CPALGQRPVALFFSRLHRKKRLRELIDLWIAEPRGNWMLLIVGLPEDYTVAEINHWIGAAGAESSIAVFDGTGRPSPFAAASLFLLPSHSENFGLVIAEALAAGVPALVTDSTPWQGLPAHDAGWCVSWKEYPATLRAALATEATMLRQMGAKGRAWMASDFTWEKSARILTEFYRELQHG
ncbi:MAG: glycosyltransferase, partial [Candidatus Didemnitutus sp.]|nr:glycosyltransferase [Candidatus Didemnitutus sp.]